MKKKILTGAVSLNTEDIKDLLVNSLMNGTLTENELADFVVSLGEDGDLTYELILLEKIVNLVLKSYPLKSISDEDMEFKKLIIKLTEIKKIDLNKE